MTFMIVDEHIPDIVIHDYYNGNYLSGHDIVLHSRYKCPWCDSIGDGSLICYFDRQFNLGAVEGPGIGYPLCANRQYSCITHKWLLLWCQYRSDVQLRKLLMFCVIKLRDPQNPWRITTQPINVLFSMTVFGKIACFM